jgi:DNA-directed RNA polymerase specialized sigma24 family protein
MNVESCDRSFVLGAQSGERTAFNALVRKCRHRFMKLSMRYARNRADAEDAVQNTFRKTVLSLRERDTRVFRLDTRNEVSAER